ncbi:helix-turn-helix domain-containing protein [Streptomyces sp. NBC_01450]
MLTLLGLPQRCRLWTAHEPADRLGVTLGVTPRTVRRDVERLSALGYPVHAIRNRSSARNRQAHP